MRFEDAQHLLATGPRTSGRTTAICEAAKSIGATVVCANHAQAEWVRKQHDVETLPLDSHSFYGRTGPFLLDHYAMEALVAELHRYHLKQLDALRKELMGRDHHVQMQ